MNPAQLPMVRPPHFIPIPPNQISITMSDIIPKESLYINNLNTKIKCEGNNNKKKYFFTKLIELKISLYFLFCPFGEILNIICYNKPNLRGQAFIIFKSTSHATMALKTLQNFSFFDKLLVYN